MKIFIIAFLFSILINLFGYYFVIQKYENASTEYLSINNDASIYIDLAQKKENSKYEHFKYRVLVPYLASIMPFKAGLSFKIITFFSLFLTYMFLVIILDKLGFSLIPALLTLIMIYLSPWQLNVLNNPFLIDPFYHLIIVLIFFAFYLKKFRWYISLILIGSLVKETTIIFAFLWLLYDLKKGLFTIILALVTLFLIRFIVGPINEQNSFINALIEIGFSRFKNIPDFIKDIYISWRLIWAIAVIGFLFIPLEKRKCLIYSIFLTLIGSISLTFIATDVGRMLFNLIPVIVLLVAYYFQHLFNFKRYLFLFIFTIYSIFQAIFTLPNYVLSSPTSFQWFDLTRGYRVILLVAGIFILSIYIKDDWTEIKYNFKKILLRKNE